ncbi:MAG TPA: phosphopantothenoylcysteine decarboxylase [Phycisphaerae bacterium]|nr:phosphopantothenoylcysteine decarboxylase [Phycisphaerales bacterium]HNO77093.1 phosphopantothenoylcysteine decarboxylase [Phycisphaerae bacterium]
MRILVTAGPTREHFDPVRFISNGSTGQMGYAIAAAAAQRGHEVVLITGPTQITPPQVDLIRVTSAQQMYHEATTHFDGCDAAIMAAAVTDWRPKVRHASKPPKTESELTVELEPTPDICAALGKVKGDRIVIGFALQDVDAHNKAEEKMRAKNCNAIVMNRIEAMQSASSTIEIKVEGQPWRESITLDKTQSSRVIVELVEELTVRNA